ncbi:MAG: GNAT family N-acetyltransferase [Vagococcus sp.]
MTISLVKPSTSWLPAIKDCQYEFWMNKEPIHGANGLSTSKNLNKWLQHVKCLSDTDKVPKHMVPTRQYLIVDESKTIVGFIDARQRLTPYLEKEGGHISYSIRKSERGKGYAKESLSLVLNTYHSKLFHSVLLTCKESNDASKQVILANNGILYSSQSVNNQRVNIYKIVI